MGGDMAVSNAIGSNVFDILLGLGLPWMLGTLIFGEDIEVDASNLMPLTLILFGTLVGVYGVTAAGGFKLTKCIGGIFFAMYFATFMAAGSSAPELFTSLMGVFAVKN